VDRLLDNRSLLRLASRGGHMTSARDLGELTISMLRGDEGNQVKEIEKLVHWLKEHVQPDVVCLSNVLLIGLAGALKRELECAVISTLQGEDTFLDGLPAPYSEQAWEELRKQARHVDLFLPVSRYYHGVMQERLGLSDDRIMVAENGIELDGFIVREELPDPPVIGFLARMTPEKGLDLLVDAFLLMRKENRIPGLQLKVGGGCMAPDERFVKELRNKISAAGFGADVHFYPNMDRDEKLKFLRGLSVLSVPASYGESFGLYLLEAMATGVPVVQPLHAAFPEIIDATGGGRLCEAGSARALANALTDLLQDKMAMESLGKAGRKAVETRFSVAAMAERVLAGYSKALGAAASAAMTETE
jgi:glycosyltransferase involved in cell wall biosynthesis